MRLPRPHFDLSHSPSRLFRLCQQYAAELYARETSHSALTPRQLELLWAVEENEGASQTELVRLTGIDRSTLAELARRMVGKDLLARRRAESDKRENALRITPKGARALRIAAHRLARAEALVLDPLPPFRRAEFLRSLAMIAGAATRAARRGRRR